MARKAVSLAIASETVSDWLAVNCIEKQSVNEILKKTSRYKVEIEQKHVSHQMYDCVTANSAWTKCAEAACRVLPDLKHEINAVKAEAPKCLEPKPGKQARPFTCDFGFGSLPFVSLNYHGTDKDILSMAHEFGHALQIVASWQQSCKSMPPLARECCAFFLELAFIDSFEESMPTLVQSHRASDDVYFGRDGQLLNIALNDAALPYSYAWNYPIARYAARRFFDDLSSEQITGLFFAGENGGHLMCQLLDEVGCQGAVN